MRILLCCAAAAACAWATPARAQDLLSWNLPASEGAGDWGSGLNWFSRDIGDIAGFAPDGPFGDLARINNGGTAEVLDDNQNSAASLDVTNGTLLISSNGVLSILGPITTDAGGMVRLDGGSLSAASAINKSTIELSPGSSFDVSGDVTTTGAWNVGLSESAAGTVQVDGTWTLGGVLSLVPEGFTPALGQSWTIGEASSFRGAFSSIESPGLPEGMRFGLEFSGGEAIVSTAGNLTLDVNRQTGLTTIYNHSGETIALNSYSIESSTGLVAADDWTSLAEGFPDAWRVANPDVGRLAELNLAGSLQLNPGQSATLGNAYTGLKTTPAGEDLAFRFTTPGGEVVDGEVSYSGEINDIVLAVDPESGKVQLRNLSSTIDPVTIKSYSILSPSGALVPGDWKSLAEQLGAAGGWRDANPRPEALNELNLNDATMFSNKTVFDLGTIYDNASDPRDLTFVYSSADGDVLEGSVLYGALVSPPDCITGDYNCDDVVDLLDFNLLKENFGNRDDLLLGAPGSSNEDGVIDLLDFNDLKANFGATAAVPEPTSLLLAAFAGLFAASGIRSSRQRK